MRKNVYTGKPCVEWGDACDTPPTPIAEHINMVLMLLAAACAVALPIALRFA